MEDSKSPLLSYNVVVLVVVNCVFFSCFHLYKIISCSLFLLCSFIKGLPVKSVFLSDELKQSIGLQPMQNGISYVISTKVQITASCFHSLPLKPNIVIVRGTISTLQW